MKIRPIVLVMMTVGQLAQHFLTLDPQRNHARLAFYHYLKNILPLDAAMHPEMLDAFYDRALSFQHWQSEKNALGEALKGDLEAIHNRNPIGFDVEQTVHSFDMQVVTLEHLRDLALLVERETKKYEKQGELVRSFPLDGREILSVRLQKTGTLIAEVRSNVALISAGELQLTRPHTRLQYTHELDFEPRVDQIVCTSLMRMARFQYDGKRVCGRFIQGHCFHRTESFEKPLEGVPELFQAVKRLEKFFVNPVTDPFYSQIMEVWDPGIREKDAF